MRSRVTRRARSLAAIAALVIPCYPALALAEGPADEREAPTTRTRPKDWHPMVMARAAGEIVLATRLATVPFTAYGFQAGVGLAFDAGPLTLGPGASFSWAVGTSEYGLDFSISTVMTEFELRLRDVSWLRLTIGTGLTNVRIKRATEGEDLTGTALHLELMVSADAYRFNEWLAIWAGVAGRYDSDVGSIALLTGLRI